MFVKLQRSFGPFQAIAHCLKIETLKIYTEQEVNI